MKIVIGGGCRCGKTTMALELGAKSGLPVVHSDDLIGLGWSAESDAFANLIASGDGVFEGVTSLRALRKLLVASDAKPCDIYLHLSSPYVELNAGQAAMNAGQESIFSELKDKLEARGVLVAMGSMPSGLLPKS